MDVVIVSEVKFSRKILNYALFALAFFELVVIIIATVQWVAVNA